MPNDDAYLETRVMTASREQLHLMVVDGAIRHCWAAEDAFKAGDREAKWRALSEATKHVGELLGGLTDVEDEFVDSLRGLFKFALRQLAMADAEDDPAKLASAVRVLELHRETWAALMDRLAKAA